MAALVATSNEASIHAVTRQHRQNIAIAVTAACVLLLLCNQYRYGDDHAR